MVITLGHLLGFKIHNKNHADKTNMSFVAKAIHETYLSNLEDCVISTMIFL